MAKKCNTKCNTDRNILLRNNVFYFRVELERVNGKRRFFCRSLHTYNIYEAREKAKIMAEQVKRFTTETFMKTLDSLWRRVIFESKPVGFGNVDGFVEQIVSDKTDPKVLLDLMGLYNYMRILKTDSFLPSDNIQLNQFVFYEDQIKDRCAEITKKQIEQNNQIISLLSNQQQIAQPAQSVKRYTIGEIMLSLTTLTSPERPTSDRKYRALLRIFDTMGLDLNADYMTFYTPSVINAVRNTIDSFENLKGDAKNKYLGRVKAFIKHANLLEPDLYKMNLIGLLRDFEPTPESDKRPHMPYSDDQLLEIFNPKYTFFKENPDMFWACVIAMFTGARQNAAITLQYQNIIQKDNIDCIQFQKSHEIKKLKNRASDRIVPVPAQLLELGFVDYIQRKRVALNASDTDFIFPQCETSGKQYNNKFTQRGILNFFQEIGVKKTDDEEQFDFHSFRNNASLRLQAAQVPDILIEKIIGWDSKTIMAKHYSKYTISQIKSEADKLRYDFLQPHFDKWKEIMKVIN